MAAGRRIGVQRIDTPFQERTAGIWGNRNFDVAAERGGAGTAEEVADMSLAVWDGAREGNSGKVF